MKTLYESLNEDGYLNELEVDQDSILEDLGLSRVRAGRLEFPDFSAVDLSGAYDLAAQTIGWQSYVAEMLARTQKRRKDAEVALEAVLNKALTQKGNMKVTEAKSAAKGGDDYNLVAREVSALTAWEDFLERFTEKTLEKYHYLAKLKINDLQSQRKG